MVIRSEEFRKAAVQKYHARGSRSVGEIAEELGVSPWSLYDWARRYGTEPGMAKKSKSRRPQDRSAAEKLKAVIEYENLSPEKQGEFLRREGLHSDHMAQWKKDMQAGLDPAPRPTPAVRAEMKELKAHNRELEREIKRKDKALAETAALIVLKKKAELLWGTKDPEEDE